MSLAANGPYRYDNLFRFPTETLSAVKDWFSDVTSWPGNKTAVPGDYSGKLLNIEPGLVYLTAAGSFNGSMRITINNEMTVDIPTHELWRPLRGLDGKGNLVSDSRFNELQIFGSEAAGNAAVLGKAFLSQVSPSITIDLHIVVFKKYTGLSICRL
jgi:hypothetical protein